MLKQKGLTLIELMISLALSCLLMSALIQQFIRSKSDYARVQKTLETTFEWQQVAELMRDSIQRAGFTPCMGLDHLKTDAHDRIRSLSVDNGKQQSLRMMRMSEDFVVVDRIVNPSSLLTEVQPLFKPGLQVLVADCFHAEVRQIKHIRNHIITLTRPLLFPFSSPIYLGAWVDERFYMDADRHGKSALFYNANRAELLTEHVTGFEVTGHLPLLTVTLTADKGEPIVVEARARTP